MITDANIINPPYYKKGDGETKVKIKNLVGSEGYRFFCLSNVIKYWERATFKGGVNDLLKAQAYLRLIAEDVGVELINCRADGKFEENIKMVAYALRTLSAKTGAPFKKNLGLQLSTLSSNIRERICAEFDISEGEE